MCLFLFLAPSPPALSPLLSRSTASRPHPPSGVVTSHANPALTVTTLSAVTAPPFKQLTAGPVTDAQSGKCHATAARAASVWGRERTSYADAGSTPWWATLWMASRQREVV